ncbi:MAG TPA: DUF6204 family protein [Iamia sp.]|nr:DUF6204 family protein [Iamia sp.]
MAVRVHRVIVRGRFVGLDEDARQRLTAGLDEHGGLPKGFTPEGTLSYDAALDFFTLRYEIRTEDDGDAAVEGEARAVADLRRSGLGHGPLTIKPTDMASIWDGR